MSAHPTEPCPPPEPPHPLSLSARLVRLEADAAELRRIREAARLTYPVASHCVQLVYDIIAEEP